MVKLVKSPFFIGKPPFFIGKPPFFIGKPPFFMVSTNLLISGSRNIASISNSGVMNVAGWRRGLGYCDAQCPKDLRFVQGTGLRPAEGGRAKFTR